MITVTRLDGGLMVINIDLIETIESTPDTLISMSNGDKLYVRESTDEIVDRVIRFKRAVLDGAGGHHVQIVARHEEEPWR
jgi:flagellar protein FlbD